MFKDSGRVTERHPVDSAGGVHAFGMLLMSRRRAAGDPSELPPVEHHDRYDEQEGGEGHSGD